MDSAPRILIIGGGYGGMHTALRLERLLHPAVASLGLYRGVAEVYGLRMRGFPAWMIHRTYHLLKLPTMNRRLRVVADWTLALLLPRKVVSLDVLEHPRQDFQAALRAIATGPSRVTPFQGQEEKEAEHHAYHQ